MNFKLDKWNKKDYDNYLKYLESLRNDKNKAFSLKLINTKYDILGIKLGDLRNIAKEIAKGDIESFLSFQNDEYYEVVLIEGFVISHIKDEKVFDKYFIKYIDKIDNWSICDSFSSSIKIIKNKDKYFNLLKKLTKSNKIYHIRLGLVCMLNHFMTDTYIDEIFNILDSINREEYYVNMAMSWLICEAVIKQKDKALVYLKNSKVNDFTYNKAISKCIDSYRVSESDKRFLKSIKR